MSYVRYIDKTREYYQGEGYAAPWPSSTRTASTSPSSPPSDRSATRP